MNIAVQGNVGFKDYNVFLRAMAVAMSSLKVDDKYLTIYSAGPANVNSMVHEFVNLSERGLKSRGKKIKSYPVPSSWISENMQDISYLAFFGTESGSVSSLVQEAEDNNVEVGIFRY
jgi:hypothetical protein